MGKERKLLTVILSALTITLSLFCLGFFGSSTAFAQESVTIQKPGGGAGYTSEFGPRARNKSGYHMGDDVGAGSGTTISANGGSIACSKSGGGGTIATVSRACCVTERFMHLKSCDPGSQTIISDNSGTSTTGAHIHWEVQIRGTWVDPSYAAGKNLCDTAIQNDVIADGLRKVPRPPNGGGGGSQGGQTTPPATGSPAGGAAAASGSSTGTGACTSPQPPQQPGNSVTYVEPGEINPVTGQPATQPIYITISPDGRVTTEFAATPGGSHSPLDPSKTDNFVGNVETDNPVTGCATDTWTAMVNQSILQTRREMLVNQTMIAKGDSVMGYACLQKGIENAAKNLGIFSESKWWVNRQIDIIGKTVTVNKELGEASLDGALANAATAAMTEFVNDVFDHDILGGTEGGGGDAAGGGAAAGGGGNDADGGTGGSQKTDNCAIMNQVWQMAKCKNVPDNFFLKMEQYIGNDPRKFPSNYACNDSGITQNMIDTAKGNEVLFDKITTHLDVLMPDNGCTPPYSTGVTVVRRQGAGIITQEQTYPDGVCVSPGCSYQNQGGSGNGTCEAKGP